MVGAKKMMSTDDYDNYNEKLKLYSISSKKNNEKLDNVFACSVI